MRWLLVLLLLLNLSIQARGVRRCQVWKWMTNQTLLMMRELNLFRSHGREGGWQTAGGAGSAGCIGGDDGSVVVVAVVPIRICPAAEERVRRSGMAESSSHLWQGRKRRDLLLLSRIHSHVHCL
jgi:hypothetical protein